MQRSRDLKIDEGTDQDLQKKLVPSQADAKEKDKAEAYFAVAKMFEYLHLERDFSPDDLFQFLEHPREKKSERIAKEIKKYFKTKQAEQIATPAQQREINVAMKEIVHWAGAYREFVDFIEETQKLKDIVKATLDSRKCSNACAPSKKEL